MTNTDNDNFQLALEIVDMQLQIKVLTEAVANILYTTKLKSLPVVLAGGHRYSIILSDDNKIIHIMPCPCRECKLIDC